MTGYDIELATRFAAWLGADVEFKVYDYGALITAAATGDVDCVMANLNITPERAEALPFSDVLYEEKMGVMVQGDAQDRPNGAYTGLSELNGSTAEIPDRAVRRFDRFQANRKFFWLLFL